MDRHTRNLKLFWTSAETSKEYLLNFEKDRSSTTGDVQKYPNLSKEVRQWTDWQTYKKFEQNWN